MSRRLSQGAMYTTILRGEFVHEPIFQILGYLKLPSSGQYRLVISDGEFYTAYAMLSTQLTYLISSGILEKYTIVQASNYKIGTLETGKRLIMFSGLEIISPGADVGEQIGRPVELKYPNVPVPSSPDPGLTHPTESSAISTTGIKSMVGSMSGIESTASSMNGIEYTDGSTTRIEPQATGSTTLPTSPKMHHNVHPINCLTPYQYKWTIRARVTNKTTMREFKSRREGKLFSMDLIDESGEIRATAFDGCADTFYDLIQTGKVYYVSKARLKMADKRFTTIKNDFEMEFTPDTTVFLCEDHTDSIPLFQFNFIPIDQVNNADKDAALDVIGVCRRAHDVETVLQRITSKELRKRDIILIDETNSDITLTLWENFAENFDGSSNPVVALKGAKIKDFRRRSLTTTNSTAIHINPDIEKTRVLKEWFDTSGRYFEPQLPSNFGNRSWKTLAQAKNEMQGMTTLPQYYKAKVTVVVVERENCMYMSCPSDECYKKVNSLDNGKYECTKCACEYDSFKWRLVLRISVADFSGNQRVTCFDGIAECLLSKSAQDLHAIREDNESEFDDIISRIIFEPFVLELRSKIESYNEENRLQTTVMSANPLNPIEFSRKLLSDIKEMEKML